MSSKINRALYGPSWTEVTFGALLSVVIGAVLAMVWLVSKPVETVRALPKEPVEGVIYYVEGSSNGTKGRSWQSRRKVWVAGKSVTVTEDELNTALKTIKSDAERAARAAKKDEGEGAAETSMITPGALNFRIHEDSLQIGAPVELNYYGIGAKVQVVAQGTFERSGDAFVFKPHKFYVGSCPIEKLPVIGGFIMNQLLASADIPTDLTEAWGKLAGVEIVGSKMKLVMP